MGTSFTTLNKFILPATFFPFVPDLEKGYQGRCLWDSKANLVYSVILIRWDWGLNFSNISSTKLESWPEHSITKKWERSIELKRTQNSTVSSEEASVQHTRYMLLFQYTWLVMSTQIPSSCHYRHSSSSCVKLQGNGKAEYSGSLKTPSKTCWLCLTKHTLMPRLQK